MKNKLIYIVLVLCIFLAVAGGGAAYYYWNQFRQTERILNNPDEVAKADNSRMLSQISKFMVLPNEEPQIATVLDKEKLKDQAFFAHAENGDKVIAYPKAQKAILFRPSINKIIEVSLLTTSTPSAAAPSPSPSPLPPSATTSGLKVK